MRLSFLPSGTDKYALVLCMCFSKINTEPMVENDCSSHFDPHLVRAGVHDVFPSAPIAKKKRIGHNLVHTCKIFVASSLCTMKTTLKTKGYEEQRKNSKN